MKFAALGVLTLWLAASSCTTTSQARSVKPDTQRKAAPDFTLKDANGQTVKLSDYKGKVVLLNFWATWCSPCAREIPWFVDLENQYKSKGFAIVGVSLDEDGWDVVKPYVGKMKINYRVLLGTDMVAQQYGGVENLPTSFMLDKRGRIASVHVGLVSKSDYVEDIEQLLAK
jgi:cytochrome c biogenesis protein CcmG/thiol:disulfide interchange protein DsbE